MDSTRRAFNCNFTVTPFIILFTCFQHSKSSYQSYNYYQNCEFGEFCENYKKCISDIPEDGGNIQKQTQKTTIVQIQVCTSSPTHSSLNHKCADCGSFSWTDRDGPHIHHHLTNISNRNKAKIFVASSV